MSRQAESIAKAILYEGYLLYPYRPSSTKNRYRWTFGCIFPESYSVAGSSDRSWLEAQCLMLGGESSSLAVQLRFLHLKKPDPQADWESGEERAVEVQSLLAESLEKPKEVPFFFRTASGAHQKSIAGKVMLSAERAGQAFKVTVRIVNCTALEPPEVADRQQALMKSFVAAHLVLTAGDGDFVSLLDPPPGLAMAAARCRNTGLFPVLVGDPGSTTEMLCSPIALYDYPQVAPESKGDFFDGTEIDELLTLRVLTLTETEKTEMRASDVRGREILERTEALPSEHLMKMHGALRGLQPVPFQFQQATSGPASPVAGGIAIKQGDRVRLRPKRSADAFDLMLKDKIAIVEAIERDFEDNLYVAVVVEDDPGFEWGMQRQPGHRFFFSPDEVEPLPAAPPEVFR